MTISLPCNENLFSLQSLTLFSLLIPIPNVICCVCSPLLEEASHPTQKMDAIRGSLSSIPGTLSNIIGQMPMPATLLNGTILNRGQICAPPPPLSSPPSSVSGDDSSSEKSHAIPASLITEEWQLVLAQVFCCIFFFLGYYINYTIK